MTAPQQETVSVIVPVYNVAPYLARCVDALLGQTYPRLEILLVDDASTDSSRQIIADYAGRDARIVPLYQAQNQGVSAARNRALDAMTGQWVCFCDGDDWYAPDFVEKMLACARREQADYVVCNYRIVSSGGMTIAGNGLGGVFPGCGARQMIACGPTASWVHLIRRELFERHAVRYPVGIRQSEELPVMPVLAKYATRTAVCGEALYAYFQRGDGTSASNAAVDSEKNFLRAWQLMSDALGAGYEAEAEYHAIYALFYGELLNLCKRGASRAQLRQKIEEYEEKFPNYRKNPYLPCMGKAKNVFIAMVHRRWISGLRLLAWLHQRIVK